MWYLNGELLSFLPRCGCCLAGTKTQRVFVTPDQWTTPFPCVIPDAPQSCNHSDGHCGDSFSRWCAIILVLSFIAPCFYCVAGIKTIVIKFCQDQRKTPFPCVIPGAPQSCIDLGAGDVGRPIFLALLLSPSHLLSCEHKDRV